MPKRKLLDGQSVWLVTGTVAIVIVLGSILIMVSGFGPTVILDGYAIPVFLFNSGNRPISDVHLGFSGGECKLDVLPGLCQRVLLINVRGESGVNVSFTDSDKQQHGSAMDVYLEPGYKGSINASIDSKNNVVWKSNIEPFPSLHL